MKHRNVDEMMEKKDKTLTVFTPAYNRGYCIENLYNSLCRQTCKDFIWLIIDDGSTDHTGELIRKWQKETKDFEIRYYYKENGGMHTAHNAAYERIDTELNVCIDSDDYMTDDAVELIVNTWSKRNKRKEYGGIIALDIDTRGKVIGTELPEDKRAIHVNEFYAKGGKGDKKYIYRTDVINSVPPYPVFEGEKYISLAYKYSILNRQYKMLVLNKPVCVVEYRTDGSSMNMYRQYINNPRGFQLIRIEDMKRATTFKELMRNAVHYVSSSIFIHDKDFLKKSPKKAATIAAILPGILWNIWIRRSAKKQSNIMNKKIR